MTVPLPQIAVMGAGAVGCYFGGLLARAGYPVVLIARPAHVQAIAQKGLRMQTRSFDEQVAIEATSDPAAVAKASIVLLSVKSADTEAAGQQIKPYLHSDALVLCLQNGVDNAERLRTVLPPAQVAAAVVYVAAGMAGPGHVRHHGRGELLIEPSAASEAVAAVLRQGGIPTQVSENVRQALWLKLVVNCAYNAVSAISQRCYGENILAPGVPQLMHEVVAECLGVAAADGVTLAAADAEAAVHNIAQTMPTQVASTAQDLARGHPTEIDHLNGYVVRRGQALQVPTPVNHALWALVKLLESRSANPAPANAPS